MGSKPEADVGLFVSSSNPVCGHKTKKASANWLSVDLRKKGH